MPLVEDHVELLESTLADAQNAPGNPGGITAALFLRPFAGSVPWAHLDIAGPARAAADAPASCPRARPGLGNPAADPVGREPGPVSERASQARERSREEAVLAADDTAA